MTDKITADTFRPFIGSAFTSETPQGRLSFTLDEVQYKERYNTGPFHRFTLMFSRPVVGGAGTDCFQNDLTKCERQKLDRGDSADMFCSEFAVFCYNCATDDLNMPRIFKKRQDRLSPEELYVHLRDNSGFSYVGELHKGVR